MKPNRQETRLSWRLSSRTAAPATSFVDLVRALTALAGRLQSGRVEPSRRCVPSAGWRHLTTLTVISPPSPGTTREAAPTGSPIRAALRRIFRTLNSDAYRGWLSKKSLAQGDSPNLVGSRLTVWSLPPWFSEPQSRRRGREPVCVTNFDDPGATNTCTYTGSSLQADGEHRHRGRLHRLPGVLQRHQRPARAVQQPSSLHGG